MKVLIILSIVLNTDSINRAGYKIYSSLETLLRKACKQEDFEPDLKVVCDFYEDDFDQSLLKTQFVILGVHFQEVGNQTPNLTIFDIKSFTFSWSVVSAITSKEVYAASFDNASYQCVIREIF